MINKKVKNATPVEYNGIHFKSTLELTVYKELVQAGFEPKYEQRSFILWHGFRPTVPFYTREEKKAKSKVILKMDKLRNMIYTPDFTFDYNGHLIIIEVKGRENDVYPIKRKMFRQALEDYTYESPLFFEVFSKDQLLQVIKIIKSYDAVNREDTDLISESPRKGY